MLALSVVVEDVALIEVGSRSRHLAGGDKPPLAEQLPCRGGVQGGEEFRRRVSAPVELCRADEQESRCDKREQKALVIRLFVLHIARKILEAFAEPIV